MAPGVGPGTGLAGLVALLWASREAHRWAETTVIEQAVLETSGVGWVEQVWVSARLVLAGLALGLGIGACVFLRLRRVFNQPTVQVGVTSSVHLHGGHHRERAALPGHRRRLGGGVLERADTRHAPAALVRGR